MSEKRLTRSSLNTYESTTSLQTYKKELKSISEEETAPVKSTAAASTSPKDDAAPNLRKSLRRSETPAVSSISATASTSQLDLNASNNSSSSELAAEIGEIKRSKRLKEQKRTTSMQIKVEEPSSFGTARLRNITDTIKSEPNEAATTTTTTTTSTKSDSVAETTAEQSAAASNNSKIITRRRSSNLFSQLRSGSSSSLSQSLNLGKKRTLAAAMELSASLKMNKTSGCDNPSEVFFENEDSNSSSIYQLPPTSLSTTSSAAVTAQAAASVPAQTYTMSKRLKSKQTAFKEFSANSPPTAASEAAGEQSAANAAADANDTDEEDAAQHRQCPITGCDSLGNLDGVSERHWSFDTCLNYFSVKQSECGERRKLVNKLLEAELSSETRSPRKSNENSISRKSLRNKCLNKEQSDHLKIVDMQMKTIVQGATATVPVNKSSTILNELTNPVLLNDIKNLTTSFIIQSIAANIAPSHLTNTLLKPNTFISTLTGMNKTGQAPGIDDLEVSQFDLNIFKDMLVMSAAEKQQQTHACTSLKLLNKSNKIIQFGNYEIETWYKSPYPDDIWQLGKIFLCQYCLNYMKSHTVLDRHLEKCVWRHPPGREIYRKERFSFFEVDGKHNKVYCQNLCLLAKLFLDHKTLYYDVEPFLFYILTQYSEATGSFQMIGYFSKEKQSVMNYNLSCILILPPYMNKSYGRLLIDFSYLLSRVEEKLGSPEKPLSDLGLISYRSYWKSKLLVYLARHIDDCEISIKEVSHETGILANDIISTFQYIGLIKYWKGKHLILKDTDLMDKYVKKKYASYLDADPACLKWTPYVYQTIIDESELPHGKKFSSEVHSKF